MVQGEAQRFIREKEWEQFLRLPIPNESVTSNESVIYFPTGKCFRKDKAQVKIRKKKIQSTAETNFKYMNSIDNKITQ